MGYIPVSYNSRVVIYERKMFIRLGTGLLPRLYFSYNHLNCQSLMRSNWKGSNTTFLTVLLGKFNDFVMESAFETEVMEVECNQGTILQN